MRHLPLINPAHWTRDIPVNDLASFTRPVSEHRQ
jgi:hypothetical protein